MEHKSHSLTSYRAFGSKKTVKSGHMYTRIYGRRRPSPYGRLCQSSNPQRYGTGNRIALPYKPYYTVTVRSPRVSMNDTPNFNEEKEPKFRIFIQPVSLPFPRVRVQA
jgi:hypothetical protein